MILDEGLVKNKTGCRKEEGGVPSYHRTDGSGTNHKRLVALLKPTDSDSVPSD